MSATSFGRLRLSRTADHRVAGPNLYLQTSVRHGTRLDRSNSCSDNPVDDRYSSATITLHWSMLALLAAV